MRQTIERHRDPIGHALKDAYTAVSTALPFLARHAYKMGSDTLSQFRYMLPNALAYGASRKITDPIFYGGHRSNWSGQRRSMRMPSYYRSRRGYHSWKSRSRHYRPRSLSLYASIQRGNFNRKPFFF